MKCIAQTERFPSSQRFFRLRSWYWIGEGGREIEMAVNQPHPLLDSYTYLLGSCSLPIVKEVV